MTHDFKLFPELTNSQMEFYYFESPHRQIREGFMAKVVRIIDGDTIDVRWQDRDFNFPVRLRDIDAPELKEGGVESALWLEKQIKGEEVYIQIDSNLRVGKFGRIIGDVIFGGQSMSDLSLMLGYSVPFGSENVA